MKLRYLPIIFLLIPSLCFALALRSNAPSRYVVKEGDTLWGIASKYLVHPWQWKKIWHNNPHIKNPDKIYPGAVLSLRHYRGRPYLQVTRRGTVRLSPRIRKLPLDNPIPPIPLSHIKPFLNGSRVFTQDELANAPYVVAYAGEHLMGGPGNKIYVKGVRLPSSFHAVHGLQKDGKFIPKEAELQQFIQHSEKGAGWIIYRSRGKYINPETKQFLGYMALKVGEAEMLDPGYPSTMLLTQIDHGVEIGDRLLPSEPDAYPPTFIPQAPRGTIDGEIIDMFGGMTQVGSNQVVVIDQGKVNNLRPGDVLAVYQAGKLILDPVNKEEEIQLPNRRVGEVMVFKVFKYTCFALVVRATDPIHLHDIITNP